MALTAGGGGEVPEGFHSEGIFLGAGVLSEVEFPSFEFHKNCFLSFHWSGGGGGLRILLHLCLQP